MFQGLCYRSITERPGFFSKDGRSLFRARVVSSVVAARQLFQGLYLKKNPRDLQLCCLKKMKHEHSCWSLKFEKNPPELFRERIVCLSNLRQQAAGLCVPSSVMAPSAGELASLWDRDLDLVVLWIRQVPRPSLHVFAWFWLSAWLQQNLRANATQSEINLSSSWLAVRTPDMEFGRAARAPT